MPALVALLVATAHAAVPALTMEPATEDSSHARVPMAPNLDLAPACAALHDAPALDALAADAIARGAISGDITVIDVATDRVEVAALVEDIAAANDVDDPMNLPVGAWATCDGAVTVEVDADGWALEARVYGAAYAALVVVGDVDGRAAALVIAD